MATGILVAGSDLDTLLEPRTTTKIANVNIKSNGGVDISNRFEDIASGSAPSATGIKKAGTDLNALFAGIGTVIAWDLSFLSTSAYLDVGALTQTYGVDITFRTAADVDVLRDIGSDILNEGDIVVPSGEAANTWIRCTLTAGDDMTGGATRGAWHRLNVQRNFLMRYASGGGVDFITGTFTFELSSDASGSPVVATKTGVVVKAGEVA